ncbi:MAG: hypothetical protein PHU85_13145 [Phycisphaerae bacterium]|nr:hypothetical protein [Phycisphaerae bacterium]
MASGRRWFWTAAAVLLPAILHGPAGAAAQAPARGATPTTQLDVIYVFSPTCEKCKEASKSVQAAAARFEGRIRVVRLNVRDPEAIERVLTLEERYKAQASPPPRIFVGTTCLTGLDAIAKELDAAIERELKPKAASQPQSQPEPRASPAGST